MAALDAMMEVKQREVEEAKEGGKTPAKRLIADPTITVDDIAKVLGKFLEFKGSKDLWPLISSPPGGPNDFHWHTPVNGDWVAKASGLLYDLLSLAPNTKVLGDQSGRCFPVPARQQVFGVARKSDPSPPRSHGHGHPIALKLFEEDENERSFEDQGYKNAWCKRCYENQSVP